MNEMLLNYIVQAILGGASGYITNDYAINMLFKEYTPFKLGGVIKKTRNEFIENLSSMIENDIVNKEKLNEIFESDEFKGKFDKLTRDFYENCLYEAVGKGKFSDVDGFDTTIEGTDEYIQKVLNENLETLIGLIADNFDAGIFLTRVQTGKIAEAAYESLKETILNTNILENTIRSLYEKNKELRLLDIFGSSIPGIDNLTSKLVETAGAKADPESFSAFNAALDEALNVFYDKQVKDIVKIDKEAISSIFSWMKDRGTGQKLYLSFLSYGRNLDKSLYSIMDPAFESILKTYIKDNLPYISELLVNYVQKNSLLIDRIIEDSIDQVLSEADGIRARILKTFKNAYLNDLSKKYRIVDKIVAYIRQFAGSEKLSLQISKNIIDRLDTITISEIVRAAEDNFNLDRGYDLAADYISKNENLIIENLDNYISKLKVKDLLPKFDLTAEKIMSSGTVRKFLKSKSRNYLNSFLSGKLNELLDEDILDACIKKTAEYLKVNYCENESTIKTYISEKLRDFEPDKNQLKSKDLTNLVYKGAYDKYKSETLKLKDVDLSSALDRLNSIDNISENSSETIRKYCINNADIILKGSIKGIVSDNLNKLTDDELVNLANNYIGRELKPIMFFGGVLGVIAGLILAAFQNSPLNPPEINIANMVTYAFVGFITNVIAINMIFRPYREIKILSKIPFLRNFSLGYIIKNQKSFAKSTAYYIDRNLLNKKSINDLFESHEDKIREGFIKNITDDDFSTLTGLLIKNREGIVRGSFSFMKGVILKNIKVLSESLYGMVSGTRLSSVLRDKSISKISDFTGESLNAPSISKGIHSLVRSQRKLKSFVSTAYINGILKNKIEKSYDGLIDSIKPDKIKTQITRYNDKYKEKTNKNMGEVINENDLSLLSDKINDALFSETFKNKATLAITGIYNRLFDRDKTFEELFDGKIKVYVDNKLPQILNLVLQKIKDTLLESKTAVSTSLRAEFKANLGFIESGLYAMMDGDKLIDDLVSKVMTEKLPVFMDVKRNEINEIVADFINKSFYKARVEVLYTGLNKLQIKEVVERYLAANKEKLKNRVNTLLLEFYDKTKNKNLNVILDLFNLKDPEGFIKSYEAEINAFSGTLYYNLSYNKDKTIEDISSLLSSMTEEILDMKVSDVFCDITPDDISRIGKNISHILCKDDGIRMIFESLLKEYLEYNKNINLGYYVDKDEFSSSVELFIERLLSNEKIVKELKQILYNILDRAVNCNFDFIDSKTKEYALNIFVEASIEALKRNLDDILKTVEFDKIAEEEIEIMEPEKIHRMFNSFAGKYFRTLMLYGVGGFVFGINMYVGFTLTGLKILSEMFKKDS